MSIKTSFTLAATLLLSGYLHSAHALEANEPTTQTALSTNTTPVTTTTGTDCFAEDAKTLEQAIKITKIFEDTVGVKFFYVPIPKNQTGPWVGVPTPLTTKETQNISNTLHENNIHFRHSLHNVDFTSFTAEKMETVNSATNLLLEHAQNVMDTTDCALSTTLRLVRDQTNAIVEVTITKEREEKLQALTTYTLTI